MFKKQKNLSSLPKVIWYYLVGYILVLNNLLDYINQLLKVKLSNIGVQFTSSILYCPKTGVPTFYRVINKNNWNLIYIHF